jgi:uncharacterized protein with HEPN domain
MTTYGSNIRWTRLNEALEFVRRKRRSDLDTDRMLVLSLIKDLEIIGEADGKVSADLRNQYGSIPWQDISGMRNRLIHVYFDIDLDVVWTTVTKDLPTLKTEIEKIL